MTEYVYDPIIRKGQQLLHAIRHDNYRAALYATAQNARRAAKLAMRLGKHDDATELHMFAERIGGQNG